MNDQQVTKPRNRNRIPLLIVAALVTTSIVASFAMNASTPSKTKPVRFTGGVGGPISFHGLLSQGAVLQGGDGQVRMKLSLGAEDTGTETVRVPTDLLVILDRSGSMEGVKIDYARRAIEEVITQLGEADRFALVSYSSGAELTIPLAPATVASKRDWNRIARRIQVGGGTNMSGGIELALATLGAHDSSRTSRVILLSDGLANEGDSSFEGLTARASRAARSEYVLSAVGIGADFNEYLMSGIADAGTGNYYYLEDIEKLASVFAREFSATRTTVATGVHVTIEPAAGVQVVDAAGYPLERTGSRVVFRPGSLFAGQQREIWVTLRVPADELGEHELGSFALGFTMGGERQSQALDGNPRIACVPDRSRMLASVDKKVWEDSVVENDYSQLQEEVARAVKQGRREEAVNVIHSYRVRNTEMNDQMASPAVTQNLAELEALEQDVENAFTGADQALKRNKLSKERQAMSWDGRRAGSKKAPKQ